MRRLNKNKSAIVAALTFFSCLGLFSQKILAAGSPRVMDGSRVTVLYEITVPGQGGVELRDVARFVQGEHQLLPALERVVTGLKTGDEKQVELSSDEGFGPYDMKKKKTVPREELPTEIAEGDVVEDRTGRPAIVTQMSEYAVVVDYNHPLAGKPLTVKLKILSVEDPT